MQAIINNLQDYWGRFKILDKEMQNREVRKEELRNKIKEYITSNETGEIKKELLEFSMLIQTNSILQQEGWTLLTKVIEMYLLAVAGGLSTGLSEEDDKQIQSVIQNEQSVYIVNEKENKVEVANITVMAAIEDKISRELDDEAKVKVILESPIFKK